MLACASLAFTLGQDAGTIDQEIERAGTALIRQAYIQRLLEATKRAVIQPNQPQEALNETRRLPQR